MNRPWLDMWLDQKQRLMDPAFQTEPQDEIGYCGKCGKTIISDAGESWTDSNRNAACGAGGSHKPAYSAEAEEPTCLDCGTDLFYVGDHIWIDKSQGDCCWETNEPHRSSLERETP